MRFSALATFVLALNVSTALAANWPQWRGPQFNGSASGMGKLPIRWSKTENIAWSAHLPGPSDATPIVWEDHVFVSSTDPDRDMLMALCFDRKTGRQLWSHDITQGIKKDYRSTYAAPTPATDGKRVFFFYGNGHLQAYDFSGKKVWARNIQKDYGPFAFQWTFSTSPLLYGGKLYLQVLQRDVPAKGYGLAGQVNHSYLLAMDPESGETLWRHFRPSKAVAESREAFTSPVPFERNSRTELVVAGGDVLTGHDPETGEEIWRWGTWNPERIGHWRLVPSPVTSENVLLVCAPKKDPIYAIKAGGTGVLDDSAVLWRSDNDRALSSDVPTPAYYDSDFFVLSDVNKSLSRVDPKTGNAKWTITTPGRAKYEASPLAADGKIYLMNFDAQVTIVNAKDGTLINSISMMDDQSEYNVRSSVVAAHGQLFIRTNTKLYCVGP